MADASAEIMAAPPDDDRRSGNAPTSPDPKIEGKRKKFNPIEKMRKFFRKSEKRKVKKDDASAKSQSHPALQQDGHNTDTDDDDGGFKSGGRLGSRSISEDSIFKPNDAQKGKFDPLRSTAISMEGINKDFQTELSNKLKGRGHAVCSSDDDDGLPHSPIPPITTADVIMGGRPKPLPDAGKSTSRESETSLISIDGSENEEDDLFGKNWKDSVATVGSKKTSGTLTENKMDEVDFNSIQSTDVLTNEKAKHKISVKPKRKVSSKPSLRRAREKGGSSPLPQLNEESPTKAQPEFKYDEQKEDHSMIQITTRPGESDSAQITLSTSPGARAPSKWTDKNESVKDYHAGASMVTVGDGLSSLTAKDRTQSPTKAATLPPGLKPGFDEVKLRPRPASTKARPLSMEQRSSGSELANAFNKRLSARIETDLDDQYDHLKTDEKLGKSPPSASGITYVLKKEPLKPTSPDAKNEPPKPSFPDTKKEPTLLESKTEHSKSVLSDFKKEPLKPKLSDAEKDLPKPASDGVKLQTVGQTGALGSSFKDKEVKIGSVQRTDASREGSPSKLASPKEDYKLRHKTRSKTLPENPVPKDIIGGHSDIEKNKRSNSQGEGADLTSVPESASIKASDGVAPVSRRSDPNRLSYVGPGSASTATAAAEPVWVAMARLRKAEQEKEQAASSEVKDLKEEKTVSPLKTGKDSWKPSDTRKETPSSPTSPSKPIGVVSPIPSKPTVSLGRSSSALVKSTTVESSSVSSKANLASSVSSARSASVSSAEPVGVSSAGSKPVVGLGSGVTSTKPVVSLSSSVSKSGVTAPISSVSKSAVTSSASSAANTSVPSSASLTSKAGVTSVSSASKTGMTSSLSSASKTGETTSVSSASKTGVTMSVSSASKTGVTTSVSSASKTGVTSSVSSGSRTGVTPLVSSVSKPGATSSLTSSTKSSLTSSVSSTTKPSVTAPSSSAWKSGVSSAAKPVVTASVTSTTSKPSIGITSTAAKTNVPDTKTTNTGTVPTWKRNLSQKRNEPQIEIIEKKSDMKVEQKSPVKQVEEKPGSSHIRDKPVTEKCVVDLAANRQSKVLDMVKNFQKLQVS